MPWGSPFPCWWRCHPNRGCPCKAPLGCRECRLTYARDRAPDPRPVRRDPDAERDRSAARHPVPDRARARGDPARLRARRPRRRAPPRPGAGDLPAAAALRGGLLRRSAGAARRRPRAVADLDRAGAGDDLCGRGRRPRAHRPALGGRLRARRHRLADRPGGRDRDRAPARRPAAAGRHDRGGEPDQRLVGADRLPGRGGGRDRRQLLALRRHASTSSSRSSAGSRSGWWSAPRSPR